MNRYLDAELLPGVREEVERHLSACPACREALAQLEAVARSWATFKVPPVPAGFADRVAWQARKRMAATPQRAWASWPGLRWWREQTPVLRAGAVATMVAGVLAGALLGSSSWRPSDLAARTVRPANAVTESLALLSGAPHGSLEQTYLTLAFPPQSSPRTP